MKARALEVADLRRRCEAAQIGFASTAEVLDDEVRVALLAEHRRWPALA